MKDFYSYLSTVRPQLSLGIALDWFFGLSQKDQIEHIETYARLKSDSDEQADSCRTAEREDWEEKRIKELEESPFCLICGKRKSNKGDGTIEKLCEC